MRKKRSITKTSVVKRMFLFLAITAGLLTSCKDYDDDIDKLDTDVTTLKQSLEDQESELTSAQSALSTQITSLKTELQSAIESGSEEAITDAAAAKSVAEAASAAVTELTATVTSLEASSVTKEELASVASDVEAINGALAALSGNVQTITNKLNVVADDVETLKASLALQEAALTGFQSSIETLGLDLTDVKAQLTSALADLAALQSSAATKEELEAAVTSLYAEIANVNSNLAVLVTSKLVTSVEFIPAYSSVQGTPIIVPSILRDLGVSPYQDLFGNVVLSYQINPSNISPESVEVVGLVKKTAKTRAAGDPEVAIGPDDFSVSNSNGTLKVTIKSDKFEMPTPGITNFYALVVNNKIEGQDRYVYSDYIGVLYRGVLPSASLSIQHKEIADNGSVTHSAYSSGSPLLLNYQGNDSYSPISVSPALGSSFYSPAFEELEGFGVTYSYKLTAASSFFAVDPSTGVVTVKSGVNRGAVGQTATVEIKAKIAGPTNLTVIQLAYVKAVEETIDLGTSTFNYVLDGASTIAKDKLDLRSFYTKTNLTKDEFTADLSIGSEVTKDAVTGAVLSPSPISLIDDAVNDKINVQVNVADLRLELGKYYEVTRTYISSGGEPFATFTVKVKIDSPTITATHASQWDGSTFWAWGIIDPLTSVWVPKAELTNAYASVTFGAGSTGTNIATGITYSYEIVNSADATYLQVSGNYLGFKPSATTADVSDYFNNNKAIEMKHFATTSYGRKFEVADFAVKFDRPFTITSSPVTMEASTRHVNAPWYKYITVASRIESSVKLNASSSASDLTNFQTKYGFDISRITPTSGIDYLQNPLNWSATGNWLELNSAVGSSGFSVPVTETYDIQITYGGGIVKEVLPDGLNLTINPIP